MAGNLPRHLFDDDWENFPTWVTGGAQPVAA
jgi:hypothetical protein